MKYFLKYFFCVPFLFISVSFVLSSCRQSGLIIPPSHVLGSSLNSTAAEQFPQFSHDGRYMAFTSDRRGERMIALYDFQKQRLIPLTWAEPTWQLARSARCQCRWSFSRLCF